jgi:diadenosine tetraphosphate (Ap4A) HIT family hydrolase
MVTECVFCSCENEEILFSNDIAFVIKDSSPVNPGHLLIIPFRHIDNYFNLTTQERRAIATLIEKAKEYLVERYAPDGYNIGVNIGEAAGQTIMHVHVHLIPRYYGDTPNPRGGVRGVIPEKQAY